MAARIRVLHHNVRHWGGSRHALCNAFREVDPDVITICSHGSGENLRIWGYSVLTRVTRELNHGWALAVKRSLRFRALELSEDGMLAVELQTNDGPIVIATHYRPPRVDNLPLVEMLDLANRNVPVYLLADLNARHGLFGHADMNRAGRMVADLIGRGKYERLGPDFPTWRGMGGRHGTPDIVLGNAKVYHHCRIWDGGSTSSDHRMVIMDLGVGPIMVPIVERYCMKRADWDKYVREIDEQEWKVLENDCVKEDVDESVEEILTRLRRAKSSCIPKIGRRAIPGPPISGAVKLTRFRLTNTVSEYDAGRATSAQVSACQRELRELARREYVNRWNVVIQGLTEERKVNPGQFWKAIKRMQGGGRNNSVRKIKNENGRVLADDGEVCEAFTRRLERVCRISPEENDAFDEENERGVNEFLRENRQRVLPLERANIDALPGHGTGARFSMADLKASIGSFKERAPGKSGVTSVMLKKLPDSLLSVILRLFNACLSMGYFPDGLKGSSVRMIPKKANAVRVEDFRPISLLETLGKVFERMLNERLMVYMESRNLYYDLQFGYRKGKGTAMAIAITYEWLARALAERNQTFVAFRDVSKAFDKVWHSGLKFKILGLGVHENLERVLCGYLDGRTASVLVGDIVGREFGLEAGVPQGGVLSPTLFNVFGMDSPLAGGESLNVAYADDVTHCVSYRGRGREIGLAAIRNVIRSHTEWELRWKVTTNLDKLKAVRVGGRPRGELRVGGHVVEWVPQHRLLGWHVGRTLPVADIKARRARCQNALARLERFRALPWEVKRQLYCALVRPILEYPPVPQHLLSKNQFQHLQRVQNRAVRWMLNRGLADGFRTETLHQWVGVEALNVRMHRLAGGVWAAARRHFRDLTARLGGPLRVGGYRVVFPSSIHYPAPVNPWFG